jgi:hypoxanthine phosphoribosyltransferase
VSAAAAPAPGRVLLDRAAVRAAVARVAREIEADFPEGVVLVGVLKGALLFLADLVRALHDTDVLVDFLAISRYAPDSGRVRIVLDVTLDLAGRDVVIVEDLVDTGLTSGFLVRYVEGLGARRVELCTLLDRPARRVLPVRPRYVGAEVPDVFLLGCGLHHRDRYRNLPVVLEVDRTRLDVQPDSGRAWFGEWPRLPVREREAGGTLDSQWRRRRDSDGTPGRPGGSEQPADRPAP